ncbi:DNA polymerase Y family protein [Streptomyces lasiicapitis]|uniref:DNA polymerase Y family protein n=1 Tax=Streptomyces lasiicapitis TaxID=1923961 RepID=UPI003D9F1EE8
MSTLYVRFLTSGAERPEGASGAGGASGEAMLPQLLAVVGEFTPVVEAVPPDAALADVSGARRYFGRDATGIAALIRVRALALYGVDCVIGAGPGPMLARMAARDAAPGVTRVVPGSPDAVAEFLDGRPVAELPGVGRAGARTLCEYGLDTVGRVAAAPLSTLQRLVGARAGRELYDRAHGVDRARVAPNAVTRSLAVERPFPRDELDPHRHRRALLSGAEELGVRLRGDAQVCRSLTLTVRYADRSVTTRTRALPEPTAHAAALTAAAYRMYEALGLQRARVRALALRAEGLAPAALAARQLTFDPADEKARRIEAVADRAREKFGPGAIVPGALAGGPGPRSSSRPRLDRRRAAGPAPDPAGPAPGPHGTNSTSPSRPPAAL